MHFAVPFALPAPPAFPPLLSPPVGLLLLPRASVVSPCWLPRPGRKANKHEGPRKSRQDYRVQIYTQLFSTDSSPSQCPCSRHLLLAACGKTDVHQQKLCGQRFKLERLQRARVRQGCCLPRPSPLPALVLPPAFPPRRPRSFLIMGREKPRDFNGGRSVCRAGCTRSI